MFILLFRSRSPFLQEDRAEKVTTGNGQTSKRHEEYYLMTVLSKLMLFLPPPFH